MRGQRSISTVTKSYNGNDEDATDALLPTPPEEAPPVKKLTSVGLKFLFIGKVLGSPENRNKRRPQVTAFDGAILTVLVDHYNNERGHSFIGCRKIAEILEATPSGIAASIRKLKRLEIILEVHGGFRNRAQRLAPNFARFVHGYTVASAVNSHAVDGVVNSHAVDVPCTAMPSTNPVGSRPKGKGHLTGAAGAEHPARAKALRGAAPSPVSADKMVALLNSGRT
jgi:hypothetical protein